MEMQQVRYFVALAETLNFTRAAERCNVSQPALTRAIQQLEAELGGALFHRERGNTHLSELGRMMLPYLAQVMEQARAAKESAKALAKLDRATLTIGAMCTISANLIAGLIARFNAQHPDVEVHIHDGGAPQMIEALGKGELEIGVIGVPEEMPEQFHCVPIFEERFVVLLPPNHRLVAHDPVRVAELDGEPYVSRSNCEVFEYVSRDFAARGVTTRKVFSSTRDDWVQSMIKAGLGFGFFPESCVTDPELIVRDLVDPVYSRTIYLATVRGRPHSPAVGAFVREARRHQWPSAGKRCPTPQLRDQAA
ncbi:LysR family transcriptional regulator [Sphingomonas sp. ID1715]|uniref:LysR family transcriptional regulator n=1 Tax=Sphingomonas sp. ID1715 TaxID=1656898 RepID=UPI0014885838|nr:LysR family transcriptional regulator [Sphingomonas sp. ID1715]NNM76474.1 LysR family transcriptional regulator [Sphingomonas sp. ID1715]